MEIKSLQVGPIGTNCYLLCDDASKVCAVIDPGDDAGRVAAAVNRSGCAPRFLLLTHGHYDHTGAVAELASLWPQAAVYIHRSDYLDTDTRLFPLREQLSPVRYYGEGDVLSLGALTIRVLHTPGHSEGSVTLQCANALFCGDTLFAGSCGRTDLPGGSMREILHSLKRLGDLEGDLAVYPGHMESSTLDRERQSNPYLMQAMGKL